MPSPKSPAAPQTASPSPSPKPTRRPPKPRATAHIDLGPLKGAIAAQSAARRMTPSAWIRETLAARLATQDRAVLDTQAQPSAEPSADQTTDPTPDYQALFTRAEAAKLDAIVSSTGRRSRIAVLRALLDGVDLGTQGQAPSTTGATLFDATQALRSSNFALVPVGRNLNQVAKSLNAYPGKTSTAERMTIEQTVSAVSKHLDRAARLIAAVAPLVKSPNTKAAKAVSGAKAPRATKAAEAAKPARTEQATANGLTP